MILDFSQNGITISFEITEQGTVALKEFSFPPYRGCEDKNLKWCPIAEVQVSGENQNDHHGAKHTGTSGSFSLRYQTHRYYENEYGNKLEFDLADEKMRVTVHYQFYRGISAVRSWTVVTNTSSCPIGLEYVSSFSYTGLENDNPRFFIPHNTWCREVNWKEYTLSELGMDRTNVFSFKRISASNTGTWSTKEYLPMAAMCDTHTTMLWQIENNGSWQWEISDIGDMLYLKISGPTEQENGWYKELQPEETFESVKACVVLGGSFPHALEQMTKYRRILFQNNIPNSKLPVIFNNYMHCLWANPTEKELIPVIDKAAEAGAEYYCIDAGWYTDGTWWESVGEWLPSGKRFPNGIQKIFDYIRKRGMVPGIWLEIEVMGINCPILHQFEDECFFMRHGKKIIDHGRYQLDFRQKKVRDFATAVVDRVVGEYGVGYIKIDYNIEGGIGTEVNSDSFGDGLLQHNRAYLSWINEIKNKYPDLILENCSSGGMRMDYAQLSKHHLQSVTDQENYRNTAYIAAAAPTAVLPEQGAIWSYPTKEDNAHAVIFNMVSPLLQRIYLGGGLHQMPEETFALVKEGVACYKRIRNDIPKAIPFYPLGIPKYGDGWLCLGLWCKDCIRLALWRMDSDKESITIPLGFKGKTVEKLYPSHADYNAVKMDEGILVNLPEKFCALLLEIR